MEFNSAFVGLKVKHQTMQTHGNMEVKLYIFLTFTVDKVPG